MFSLPLHPNIKKRPYENGFFFSPKIASFLHFLLPAVLSKAVSFLRIQILTRKREETDPDFSFFWKSNGKVFVVCDVYFFSRTNSPPPQQLFHKRGSWKGAHLNISRVLAAGKQKEAENEWIFRVFLNSQSYVRTKRSYTTRLDSKKTQFWFAKTRISKEIKTLPLRRQIIFPAVHLCLPHNKPFLLTNVLVRSTYCFSNIYVTVIILRTHVCLTLLPVLFSLLQTCFPPPSLPSLGGRKAIPEGREEEGKEQQQQNEIKASSCQQ